MLRQRLWLLLSLAPASLLAQDPLVMRIEAVAPQVYVISGFTNGNLLALVGSQSVLLVDAQSEKRVALADSALHTVTSLPVRTLVNTHYHEDHIGGNPYWRARGATIIAQRNLTVEARKDTTITELEWHRTPAPPEALPDRTFDDSVTLDHEGQTVILLHPRAAHTSGDAMIWLPALNIIHTGDLLEIGAPPFLDWWGGGTLDGMIAGIDQVLRITNDRTVYVPGHGNPVRRNAVMAYRSMLVAVRERITPKVLAGEAPETIAAALPLADYDSGFGGAGYTARFVRIIAMGLARSK